MSPKFIRWIKKNNIYAFWNFRYTNFFSKNITYVDTEKSNWNLDDGYSFYLNHQTIVDVTPSRTSGVSYYHRLRLVLHTLDDDFLSCANLGLGIDGGRFMVRNSIYTNIRVKLTGYIIVPYCTIAPIGT